MTSILKRDDQMAIPPSRSLVHVVSAVARPPLKPILADFRETCFTTENTESTEKI
jgi:hypothetical protein